MKKNSFLFKITDKLLIVLSVIPIIFAMALKVLTHPFSEDISITGAYIYFTLPMPLASLPITESQINSWLIILSLFPFCLYLTHGINAESTSHRQIICEWIVEKNDKLVHDNMGDFFSGFSPFIAAVTALSAFSSLISLLGLYPPTSDLNVVSGWAILVFILITHYKLKCGTKHYIKSFTEPVAFLAPLNIIGEFATPVSMAFRHYGNILSGAVLSVLVAAGLQRLSDIFFGRLPGILGQIPFLQIGLSAVLSIYFDIFSGLLQAFIFAMLTMLYISGGFPSELYANKNKEEK